MNPAAEKVTGSSFGARLWRGWARASRAIAGPVTAVWMGIVYLLVLPFFLLMKLADPLRLRPSRGRADSCWEDYPQAETTLSRYRRMF